MKQVLTLILMAVAFLTQAQQTIEISDVTNGRFSQRSVRSVRWMNDGQFYTALKENQVIKYNVRSGDEVETLIDGKKLGVDISDYTFSDDESQALILTARQYIYRRSYTAKYFTYVLGDDEASPLSDGTQSYATYSPDGKKVAFARDNNIFYKDLENGAEVAITTDGAFNKIINGSTDWVYEEELYLTKAFEWSPDSKKIAYYRFDESKVREYNMQVWPDNASYPTDYLYKYPKAGEANSKVEIFIYDLASRQKTNVDIGAELDIYIPKVSWTRDPSILAVQRLNRLQNRLDLLHVNASSGLSKTVLTEESKTYIDFTNCDDLYYIQDGKHFLFSSESDGWKHFYLYTIDGKLVNQITRGLYEVVSLEGIDESQKPAVLYYTAREASPLEQELYRIGINGKKKKRLTAEAGKSSVNMSPDCSYYMQYFSSAKQPLKVSLFQTNPHQLVKVLEDNAQLRSLANTYGFRDKEFFKMPIPGGLKLNGYFLKPDDFDEKKKYPVLLYQYSGPGAQDVVNAWGGGHFEWHQYLAQQGYIVAVIDTRGTGYRGADFKKMTYKQLGKLETEDLISAGKYLASLPYTDPDRIGIWGWSYGGYMSSLAILKGADVFSMAIAVAPVTTWRFYDTIYTERYLQRPQDNPEGYDENSPIHFADQLKGDFLLIHGTGDDNVHFQNAIALERALIDAGKQFDTFYYPDEAHGLYGVREHLYEMMSAFVLENL